MGANISHLFCFQKSKKGKKIGRKIFANHKLGHILCKVVCLSYLQRIPTNSVVQYNIKCSKVSKCLQFDIYVARLFTRVSLRGGGWIGAKVVVRRRGGQYLRTPPIYPTLYGKLLYMHTMSQRGGSGGGITIGL